MQQTFKALPLSLAVSALLIYMILAARYEDLLRPLAIMFSISLAPIGAFLACGPPVALSTCSPGWG
tara:strand:+ start:156 stop:353 length:198 start_codon:yes stop_codon:yes gene_type:complete